MEAIPLFMAHGFEGGVMETVFYDQHDTRDALPPCRSIGAELDSIRANLTALMVEIAKEILK